MRNEILQGIFGGLIAIFIMVMIGSTIARSLSHGPGHAPAAGAGHEQAAPAADGAAAPAAH